MPLSHRINSRRTPPVLFLPFLMGMQVSRHSCRCRHGHLRSKALLLRTAETSRLQEVPIHAKPEGYILQNRRTHAHWVRQERIAIDPSWAIRKGQRWLSQKLRTIRHNSLSMPHHFQFCIHRQCGRLQSYQQYQGWTLVTFIGPSSFQHQGSQEDCWCWRMDRKGKSQWRSISLPRIGGFAIQEQ